MKGRIITSVCLIIVGAVLCGIALAGVGFDFKNFSTEKFETNTYEFSDKIDSIDVKFDTMDITFAASENGKCYAECYESAKDSFDFKLEDGVLKITCSDSRQWLDHFAIISESPKITLYLPDESYKSLKLNSSTGDVKMTASKVFDKVDISVSTGDISFSEFECSEFAVKTDTGDVELDGVVSGKMNIKTNTGDVKFSKCDADEIYVKTSTGDVKGSLLSEKEFITKTSTGSVSIPKTSAGGRCEITTSTGDIKITI